MKITMRGRYVDGANAELAVDSTTTPNKFLDCPASGRMIGMAVGLAAQFRGALLADGWETFVANPGETRRGQRFNVITKPL